MTRNRLLLIGTICLALGLGLGAFFVARGDSAPATTTSTPTTALTQSGGATLPPATGVPAGPVPTDASGDPVTTLPGQTPGTGTTMPGAPTTIPGSPPTTVIGGGSPVTTAPTQSTDPKQQLAATAAQAGFPLYVLDDPAWKLQAVRSATVGDKVIVDLSYVAGGDYLSISQESVIARIAIPNSQPVTVHGAAAELLDMNGVIVIRWNEAATSIALSTSLTHAPALAAAEKLSLYKG